MYIKVDKIKEDENNAWYDFRTNTAGERYINERGIPRLLLVEVKGICVFNKSTEAFTVDWDPTDNYFKESRSELVMIQYRLMKYNKIGNFPEIFDIATG